ncbi:MAG: 2-oxoacid:acceptor oxidoreductase family protein [Planctomycetes bacterium]|nr:2-oxoacid:acceptor oxidoreductase family protein [Planctomycetota bacterium]
MIARAERPAQIVIFGLGGQGILFLTKLLAEAAAIEGRGVIVSENHGMSQRGGAVESHVKIGDFAGPLVRRGRADATLAIDPARLGDARAFGGECFANAAAAEGARALDAAAIARELGNARAANIALAGFAAAARPDLFPARASLLAALEKISPPKAIESNRKALLKGMESA